MPDSAKHAQAAMLAALAVGGSQAIALKSLGYGLVFAASSVCFPVGVTTAALVLGSATTEARQPRQPDVCGPLT